jgi:hypothetical protein
MFGTGISSVFAGRSPFSFSALDVKTMAMVMLRKRLSPQHQECHAQALVR